MIASLRNMFTIKEFTGRHMLAVLFLFFGTIITVNLTLTWFAVGSWSGLVAKNGYVASIDFKAKQEEVERQNKLGWKSQLKHTGGHVVFSLKDNAGKPITDLKPKGFIGRPTTEALDKPLVFKEGNKGEYLAPINIGKGQWDVEIQVVNANNDRYRKLYRLVNETGK